MYTVILTYEAVSWMYFHAMKFTTTSCG